MSSKIRDQFSSRLKQALNEAGYQDSQLKDLGELFDVSPQAVRKWLHSEAMPSSSRAPQVAERLGVRRAWLLDGEEPMRSIEFAISEKPSTYNKSNPQELTISSSEFRLLKNYRKLSKKLRKTIELILEDIIKEVK